jgi:hypothetical protein
VGWRAVSVAGLCNFVDADAKELFTLTRQKNISWLFKTNLAIGLW